MPAKNNPNHGFAKRAGFHSCRLFLLCIFFGLKPTCTISPQCLHFISSTTFPGGISSMSKMRRPHLGFGHFTFSIDHRLPALICNKGNQSGTIKPGWFPFIICALCIFRAASAPECIKPDYLTAPYKISFHWQKTLHSSLIPYLTDSPAVLQFSSQPQCCCPSPHRKMSSFPPVAKSCSIASCDNVLENPCGNGFTPVSASVFCHASFSVSVVCSS